MQVIDAHLVDFGLVTKGIGGAVMHTATDPAACQPISKGMRVVVSTRIAALLGDRQATELSAPDYQGLL